MANILRKLIIFLLSVTLLYATTCPSGEMIVSSFPGLTGEDFASPSGFYDAIYKMEEDKMTGTHTLVGYRLNKVQNDTSAYFDVKKFVLGAKSSWKIVAVSYLGNCVIVEQDQSLLAFTTDKQDFYIAQKISPGAYSSIISNEDCSLLRVTLSEGGEAVYQHSVLITDYVFPTDSIFDNYLIYGLDSSKTLRKVTSTGIQNINLGSGAIQDTPVSIMNRKDLNVVIVVTKAASTQQFTVTIVNTLNDKRIYSKSWAENAYSGNFITQLSPEGNFVLVRDSAGFLLLLRFRFSRTKVLEIVETKLENSEDSPKFSEQVLISFTSNAVVSYFQGKMVYFQPYANLLYLLSEISVDLVASAIQYAQLSSPETSILPTLIEPNKLPTCDPWSMRGYKNQKMVQQVIIDQQVSVAFDAEGNTMKCDLSCLSCTNDGFCQICSLGYSLSDTGKCVFCQGCRSCKPQDPDVCLSCFSPQVLNPISQKCQKPKCSDFYCLTCDNEGTCQQCMKGYSVYDGACVKCQEGCSSCSNSGPDSCDLTVSGCKLGYILSPFTSRNVNYTCAQCATGCTSCSLTDISNCTSCNEGFYPALNSATNILRCSVCMENCRSCSNGNTCDRCMTGFRLNEDKTKCIERCDSNCLTCSETNKFQCLSCYSGSSLHDGKCLADLQCNTESTCTACGDGYVLSEGQCLKCTYTDTNCEGCSAQDLGTCFKCKFGYYLNANRQCVKCQDNCSGCLSDSVCISCNSGFYLTKTEESVTGTCLACNDECKTCNQFSYLCTSCKDGYILDGSKCISLTHVIYTLTINCPVEEMAALGRTLLLVLEEFAQRNSVDPANPLKISSRDITINMLRSGSTVTSGSISTFTRAQSELISDKIGVQLLGVQLEKGYSIIAVESKTVVPDDNNQDPTAPVSSSSVSSLAIILGVLIPLILLIIAAVIIIVVKVLKREKVPESGPGSNQEYFINESSKTINKTSQQLEKV